MLDLTAGVAGASSFLPFADLIRATATSKACRVHMPGSLDALTALGDDAFSSRRCRSAIVCARAEVLYLPHSYCIDYSRF